jgi:hypothetical protein
MLPQTTRHCKTWRYYDMKNTIRYPRLILPRNCTSPPSYCSTNSLQLVSYFLSLLAEVSWSGCVHSVHPEYCQSHLAINQETWVRMAAEFCLRNEGFFTCYGFLSPLKIHRPRPGLNPRPVASTLTTSPPRATNSLPSTHLIITGISKHVFYNVSIILLCIVTNQQ